MVNCIKCGIEKTKNNTNTSKTSEDGLRSRCKVCLSLGSKEYEKTPAGYLMRSYRNMKSRVDGVQKRKLHLYDGLYLLPKEEFKTYIEDENFLKLLSEYEKSKWDSGKAPSVDRIYPWFGYHRDNIRWVSHSENSAHTRGAGKNKSLKYDTENIHNVPDEVLIKQRENIKNSLEV